MSEEHTESTTGQKIIATIALAMFLPAAWLYLSLFGRRGFSLVDYFSSED